jgi:hypothetical protein
MIRRFIERLLKDDPGKDTDGIMGNTWTELFLAWIAICLTLLVIFSILYYIS